MAKSNVIQFRVPDEVADQLQEMADEAKTRGVAGASKNKVARVMMQLAMGMPPKKVEAFEVLIDAYAVKQQFNNRLGELIAGNLDELLEDPTGAN